MAILLQADFSSFASQIGEALNVGDFGGGLIATTILIFAVMVFLGVATRGRPKPFEVLIVTMPVYSFCVYMTWFPVWTLAVLIVMIALFFGRTIIKKLGA